jgi:hypothetical protein
MWPQDVHSNRERRDKRTGFEKVATTTACNFFMPLPASLGKTDVMMGSSS